MEQTEPWNHLMIYEKSPIVEAVLVIVEWGQQVADYCERGEMLPQTIH